MHPSSLKLVIVDPKKIELAQYGKLKNHFLAISPDVDEEIITTPHNAVMVLKGVEFEMERRYDRLSHAGVRNIADYNEKLKNGKLKNTDVVIHTKMPYLIVVIDELADLMITAAREVEEPIARLAQLARAVGIHLIVATQRPSVDVITGVIKANFPARIAYQVASKTDSRTILDMNGAEQLLGNGDMLYLPSGSPKPVRLQNAYISPDEVDAVVDHIGKQQGYARPFTLPSIAEKKRAGGGSGSDERDELFDRSRAPDRAAPAGFGVAAPAEVEGRDIRAPHGSSTSWKQRASWVPLTEARPGKSLWKRKLNWRLYSMNDLRWTGKAAAWFLLLFASLGMFSASQSADDVLEKVRKRYDAVTDAELRFAQKIRFSMTKVEQQVSGTLFIKKKNKYRVEMDDRVIVTDGETIWSYSAANNQVVIDKFKQDEQSLSPEKILVGTPDNFTATLVGEEKLGGFETTVLKLVPKDEQSFIHSLRLWVDEKEWMIRQVEVVDVSEKQTIYSVLQVRTNTGLQDSRFVYQIPKGAEVVDLR